MLNYAMKWVIVILVIVVPFFLSTAISHWAVPTGLGIAVPLILGYEATVYLFQHEYRHQFSLFSHEQRRDRVVSLCAFFSFVAVYIFSNWVMHIGGTDRFLLGAVLILVVPVSIILLGGSSELKQKFFKR